MKESNADEIGLTVFILLANFNDLFLLKNFFKMTNEIQNSNSKERTSMIKAGKNKISNIFPVDSSITLNKLP